MTFELYTDAVLARDLPSEGLRSSDVVKIVDHHPVPDGEDGYSIEVFNAMGDTIAVTSVPESALEPLLADEVFSVRQEDAWHLFRSRHTTARHHAGCCSRSRAWGRGRWGWS